MYVDDLNKEYIVFELNVWIKYKLKSVDLFLLGR